LEPVRGRVSARVVVVTPPLPAAVVVVVTAATHGGLGIASAGAVLRQLWIPEVLVVSTVAPALTAKT
jgi:hypothetical protein